MRRAWSLAILALILLAGCSDSKPVEDDDEDVFDDLDVTTAADKGVIRGVVVDEAIIPVAGATIVLENVGLETQSTENGAFVFTDLEPGTYFLKVDKVGYDGVQTSTDVQAGVEKPPILKVQLRKDPEEVPFVVPHSYTGYISCGFKVQNIVFDSFYCDPAGTGAFGEDDSITFIPVERAPDYYQNEIQWRNSQTLGDGLVTIQWACGEDGGCSSDSSSGNRLCNVRGPSPLVCSVNKKGGGGSDSYTGINGTQLGQDGRGIWIQMFSHCAVCHPPEAPCVGAAGIAIVCPGAGYGVAIQQTFDLYTHIFYNFEPAEGWLFIEDGAPPVPAH